MSESLVAVDIGNSFLHLARYDLHPAAETWPETRAWHDPSAPHVMRLDSADERLLTLLPSEPVAWCVTSVHRGQEARLREWLTAARPSDTCTHLTYQDFSLGLGLTIDVEYPARVGLDRLASACAVNRVRPADRAAIVVDAGTALTVDLIDAEGVFRGGAIFPGLRMLSDALHQFTDALPRVAPPVHAPAVVGRWTEAAIQSGLYFGASGAVRELVRVMASAQPAPPLVVVTGGHVWQDALRDWQPRVMPDLVLAGTVLAGRWKLRQAGMFDPSAGRTEGSDHAGRK